MPDGRKNNGGYRPNAGRKPKADEEKLRDKLSPYATKAIETVINLMENGENDMVKLQAAKLFFSYNWGMPKQSIDHTTGGEQITNITVKIKE